MNKFIIKILCFILPIIIVAITLECLLINIPNDYSYKKNYLDKHSSEIETLILGSSHTFYGINPEFMAENTFNASHVSQSLDYDFAILTKYQNNFSNLKVIVLPISYFTLWGNLSLESESWRVKNYVIYYGITQNAGITDYSELLSNTASVNKGWLYKYYIHKENNISSNSLGWGTSYNSSNAKDLQETGKTAAKRHTQDDIYSEKNEKLLKGNIKTLNLFADFCQERNIKLILITTPTYYTYRENLNKKQLDKMFQTINDFCTQNHCPYFNYFESSDFVAKDFYDADHLNEIGAEKLSKKLAHDIDSLGLLK
ncbi:MAG: hypothetical protein LBT29_02505 [Flavobacteriaceae bacterium]|jgi:hypothetical protein|nr:hypothetical protein [Flavobacteriaceae bacterium]